MNLKTFYKIYYHHRFLKASFFLKIYLSLTLCIKYLINYFYLPKKRNLDNFSIDSKNLFEKDFNYLCELFNSDKGERFTNQYAQPSKKNNQLIDAHGYAKIYENYFKEIKKNKMNIIELGAFYGNASAALYFYFKNSFIFSADINPDMFLYRSKRIKNFYTDTSSRSSIQENLLKMDIKFDIIIEDASHMLKDQIISLFMLFKSLQSGGLFIIEEIDFPEKREDMRINQNQPDLKTILKKANNNENFSSEYVTDEEKKYFLNNFQSISFFRGNTNEFVIIKKK